MVTRIQQLIKELGLSPSQFADEIGVQRSAMSHLVSGRNNPSLEFVMKTLKRFPQVNTEWLLTGSGAMTGSEKAVEQVKVTSPELFKEIPELPPVREEVKVPYEKTGPAKPLKPKKESSAEKEIERIIIIYNDRSFREILPE